MKVEWGSVSEQQMTRKEDLWQCFSTMTRCLSACQNHQVCQQLWSGMLEARLSRTVWFYQYEGKALFLCDLHRQHWVFKSSPLPPCFFFLETNYNRILGHRIEWWNCRTWGMKAWSAGSPFTPLPLDLYSFISASTPSSSLDTPIKSIISYIVRNLVLHFTDLF